MPPNALQTEVANLRAEIVSLKASNALCEQAMREAENAGTPYWKERDAQNSLILENASLQAKNAALLAAAKLAHEAIDPFLADQSYAKDPRCGLVQPVSVEDCNKLGRAFNLLNITILQAQQPE